MKKLKTTENIIDLEKTIKTEKIDSINKKNIGYFKSFVSGLLLTVFIF
jgi:hypothetical protein